MERCIWLMVWRHSVYHGPGDRLCPWQREFGASVCYIVATRRQSLSWKWGWAAIPKSSPQWHLLCCFPLSQGFKSYQKAVLSRDPQFRHLRAKLQYLMSSCYDFFLHTIASALFCGRVIDKYNPPLFTGCIDIFWYKHTLWIVCPCKTDEHNCCLPGYCACSCIEVCVCFMHVYMCVLCVCMCIYICVVCLYVFVHMCLCACLCVCLYMHVCMFTYIYLCMYVYVCMYV